MPAPARPIETRNRGFWGWVERQVILLQRDPERRARAFRIAWWVSTAVVLLGVALILFMLIAPAASAHPADGRAVEVNVTLVQAADGAGWTITQSQEWPAARLGTHVWWPRGAAVASMPPGARIEIEDAHTAALAWPTGGTSLTVDATAPGPLAGVRVPVSADRVVLRVALQPGHEPVEREWRRDRFDVDAWTRTLAGAQAGEDVPLTVRPPEPAGVVAALWGVALAALAATLAGGAWARRERVPPAGGGFLDHLRELQARLTVPFLAFGALAVLFFTFGWRVTTVGPVPVLHPVPTVADSAAAAFYRLLVHEFVPAGVAVVALRPVDAAVTIILVALFLAALAVAPLAAWQAAAFVAPGLVDRERAAARRSVPVVLVLFAAGCAFAWWLMVPLSMRILYGYATALGAVPYIGVNELVGFALLMTLAFGAAFELPVVMVVLASVGLVGSGTFAKYWRHAVVGIFFLAGLITPDPTVVSMVLLALPLCGLYVVGILAARAVERRRGAAS